MVFVGVYSICPKKNSARFHGSVYTQFGRKLMLCGTREIKSDNITGPYGCTTACSIDVPCLGVVTLSLDAFSPRLKTLTTICRKSLHAVEDQ